MGRISSTRLRETCLSLSVFVELFFPAVWRVDTIYWIFPVLVRAENYGHKFGYVTGVKYYCYCPSFHDIHALSFCQALLHLIS